MANNNAPGQRRALGPGIGSLGREELITLARAVCGQAAAFAGGHGNIHPENIFMSADGSPWLGERADHAPGEWTTDELEYMAPELFWSGALDARADVYSIGLLLYAGVTRGRLPFFPCAAGEMTNSQRAAALRRRMNGEGVPIPTIAGERMGEVLRRCLAFTPEARYADTIELSMALEPCVGEGDAAAMAMFGKPEHELSEVERTMAGILASYSADEAANAEPEPQPVGSAPEPEAGNGGSGQAAGDASTEETEDKSSLRPAPQAASLGEAGTGPADTAEPEDVTATEQPDAPDVESISGGQAEDATSPLSHGSAAEAPLSEESGEEGEAASDEPETQAGDSSQTTPENHASPVERIGSETAEASDLPGEEGREALGDGTGEPKSKTVLWLVIGICGIVAIAAVLMNILLPRIYPAEPVVIPTPTEAAGPASTPEPTPSATPEATPAATPEATPSATPEPAVGNYEIVRSDISWTAAEQRAREMGGHLAVIRSQADFNRVTALADTQGLEFVWVGLFRVNGALQWVDPEAEGWYNWADGEPSGTDADGTAENFVLLWRTEDGWVYNDSRNDPATLYPSIYSGSMGFAVEYD